MALRVLPSAKKHGYNDVDIRHALRNQLFVWPPDDKGCQMSVGPSRSGELLEIGVVRSGTDVLVIHADRARKKFLRGRRR